MIELFVNTKTNLFGANSPLFGFQQNAFTNFGRGEVWRARDASNGSGACNSSSPLEGFQTFWVHNVQIDGI